MTNCDNTHHCVSECVFTPSACLHVCVFLVFFLPQQAPQCCLPLHSINAQPCPRLICHSCCIFAFILICTSPLNQLSICPSRCSNLIVFVHYRWAFNKVGAQTRTHPPTHPAPACLKPPLSFKNHLPTTPTTHIPRLPISALYLMS